MFSGTNILISLILYISVKDERRIEKQTMQNTSENLHMEMAKHFVERKEGRLPKKILLFQMPVAGLLVSSTGCVLTLTAQTEETK